MKHEEMLNLLLDTVVDSQNTFFDETVRAQFSLQADEIAKELLANSLTLNNMNDFFRDIKEEMDQKEPTSSEDEDQKENFKTLETLNFEANINEAAILCRKILNGRQSCFSGPMDLLDFFFCENRYNAARNHFYSALMEVALDAKSFNIEHATNLINQFINDNAEALKSHMRRSVFPPKALSKLLKKLAEHDDSIKFSVNSNDYSAFEIAYLANVSDDGLIELISNDTEEQKVQLQYTLGVMHPNSGRMNGLHTNNRIKTQSTLINQISDSDFLTNVLRDFILRPNDGGQVLLKNSADSVRLLMVAGANVNATHMDKNYVSAAAKNT